MQLKGGNGLIICHSKLREETTQLETPKSGVMHQNNEVTKQLELYLRLNIYTEHPNK